MTDQMTLENTAIDLSAIEAEVRAGFDSDDGVAPAVKAEEPKVEAAVDDSADEQEEVAGESEEVDSADDAGEDDDAGETVAATSGSEKKKSKYIPRGRFDEVNEKAKALEAGNAAIAAEKLRIEKENEEMKAFIRDKLTKKEEVEEEIEPLDKEADAAYKKEFAALRQEFEAKSFMQAVASEDAAWGARDTAWAAKKEAVIANEAYDLMIKGHAATDHEAIAMANKAIGDDLYRVYKSNGSMGEYLNRRAEAVAKRWPAKEKQIKTVAKTGVDMAELDKLRKSAGASTNKVTATNVEQGGSMEADWQEARKEVEAQSWA